MKRHVGFREAVVQTSGVRDAYRPGLQALEPADRAHIRCASPRDLAGSMNIDAALESAYPNDPRWDYAIGISRPRKQDRAIWIEVHPASSSGNVAEVMAKRAWLTRWLENAPVLRRMPAEYVWIPTGRVCFRAGTPQRNAIAAKGIRFVAGKLDL